MADGGPERLLVERARAGDRRAFDLLVLKYQHRLVKLIGRYVRDHAEVLDVAQDSFIKAYRALPNFRAESAFYTWLYRIAINTAKNHLASQSRRIAESAVDVDDAEKYTGDSALREMATPERLLMRDEVQQAVMDAFDELPEELRTAITLREIDGMSYEDIATAMECPIGTVRSRIFRAREAINRWLEPLMG
jgi:RNA polymerase sigma-70 factor (ECF subfamily)